MARKKEPAPKAKPEPSFKNSPFAAAADELRRVVKPPAPPPSARPKAPPPKPSPPAQPVERDERQVFAEEMAGVMPLQPDVRGRVGAPPPSAPRISRRDADEAEVYAELADLIEGHGPFDFVDTDEYIEGIAPGLDRRLLRKLRRGDFALQGHIDLHGLTREEAYQEVEGFISRSRIAGKRCLLIIHGRGHHSKDQVPVLKDRIKAWLERGRISRSVLAFASARPCDGGAGAVYVLLRR